MPGKTQEPRTSPTDLPRRSWVRALRRTRPRIKQLNISLLAAGVAFWALLSLFPALIAVVTIYGLVRSPADAARQVQSGLSGLSPDLRHTVGQQVAQVAGARQSALSLGLVLSLLVLLWTTSSGMQSLLKALSAAFEQRETRGFLRLRGTAIVLALGGIVVAAILIAAVGVVPAVLKHVLGSPALRWLLIGAEGVLVLLVLIGVIAVLYRFGPASRPAGWRWASAGAVVSSVVIVLFTIAFAVYVNNFGHYNKTYGALAGVVVLMLWLYYSSYVLLLGALLDAEGERQAKGDGPAEPEQVDRDVVRSPQDVDLRQPTGSHRR